MFSGSGAEALAYFAIGRAARKNGQRAPEFVLHDRNRMQTATGDESVRPERRGYRKTTNDVRDMRLLRLKYDLLTGDMA